MLESNLIINGYIMNAVLTYPVPLQTHFLSAGATLIAVLFLLLLFLSAVKSAEE